MRRIYVLLLSLIIASGALKAQPNVHPQSTEYTWPSDSLVRQKLDKWQDQKFGMIIHWGLYSVPGIIESWALCSENWIERDSTIAYDDFKKWYWGLSNKFNPVNFNPDQWAKSAKDAGMKYVVFTTKHHDGFCMFNTRETDFSIAKGPFRDNPRSDVLKYVFGAFRKQNFMIGAYFSKPDWHSEYYWWPKYATPDRNNNYDIRKYPWRWNQFKRYSYNQISEIMHNYGQIDILWLDGGWVRPPGTINDEVKSWGAPIPSWEQDIDIPHIASMARAAQPGILVVDRTVHGLYENYQTPEQKIPEKQLGYPWETCMSLGDAWGYVPNDRYKKSTQIIHTLIEVVAKGGSLLLGVGPKADGTLPPEVVLRLEEIGKWTRVNGEAIYNTRNTPDYHSGNIWFTQRKDAKVKYAIVCFNGNEPLPKTVKWTGNSPQENAKMVLLGTGEQVNWVKRGITTTVSLPGSFSKSMHRCPAVAFSYEVR